MQKAWYSWVKSDTPLLSKEMGDGFQLAPPLDLEVLEVELGVGRRHTAGRAAVRCVNRSKPSELPARALDPQASCGIWIWDNLL